MKKLFIFFAIIAYAGVAVYSLTRLKPPLSLAQAHEAMPTAQFKLLTGNQEALMQFYSDVFGTDWQAVEGGYEGQVLDTTVMIAATKTKRRTRRATLQLQTDDLEAVVTRVLDAGGNVKARNGGAVKSFVATDPDGNAIVLTQAAN